MEFQKRVISFSDMISKPDTSMVYRLSVISAKFEKLVNGKWQFSIQDITLNFEFRFEFELSEDGLIKEVAHHNEDHHDVINFKKVLASVFSAIRKVCF